MAFCKENGGFNPTTMGCCPNVDLMALKALRTASRRSWRGLGVKVLFVQGGAEATDERVLALRTVRCRVRDEISHFREGRT